MKKTNPQKRKSTEIILEEIKKGTRYSKLCSIYPGCINYINKLMQFRPMRKHRTDVLYIYGPSGIGKTTAIQRTLQTLTDCYPEYDFYTKMGGLDKWWDGYDNQPIVWIDDPIAMDGQYQREAVQRLKNVISHGHVLCEIKGGSMVFDAQLIIISSNFDPRDMAASCGMENFDAIFRRLTDTCGAQEVKTRADCLKKMIEYILLCVKEKMNPDLDIKHVVQSIPSIVFPNYAQYKFHDCNTAKYFD